MVLQGKPILQTFSMKIVENIQSLLGKQKSPSPLLFFALFIYRHRCTHSQNEQVIIFLLQIFCYYFLSFNMFYFFTPLLLNPFVALIHLILGIFSSNQKWKLYLFLFILGDTLNISYQEPINFYSFCASVFMCLEIYNNLIFETIQDCRFYLIGFLSIALFEICSCFQTNYFGQITYALSSIFVAILGGGFLLNKKLNKITNQCQNKIKNGRILNFRIKLKLQSFKQKCQKSELFQTHRNQCEFLDCFCKKSLKSQKINFKVIGDKNNSIYYFLTRTIYENAIKLKIQNSHNILVQFIKFLIKNEQLPQAIFLYLKHFNNNDKLSFFEIATKIKLKSYLKGKIKLYDYYNIYGKQFSYVFTYDKKYLQLTNQIKQILKIKHQFWRQTANDNPVMTHLQRIGTQIVERMQKLNEFYHFQIQKMQDKIKMYSGSIVYSMYLLSTTNYKQFAENLIKNISRNIQSIKLQEQNYSSLVGLKLTIRTKSKSFNQNYQNIQVNNKDKIINQKDEERINLNLKQKKDDIDQVITNISGSLCKLLNYPKQEIIGSNISTIIPKLYRQKHHEKIKKLVGFSYTQNQLHKLRFLNQVRQIQFRTINGQLVNGKVSIKIFNQFDEQISFIATVSIIEPNKSTIICDLQGEVYEFQQTLQNVNLIKVEQIVQTIKGLKKQWEEQKQVSPTEKVFKIQKNHYTVRFNSPYQQSFVHNRIDSKQQQPPLHIDIFTQQSGIVQTKMNLRNKQATNYLQKIQQKYCIDQNSSQTSAGTRKSSVINVLNTFSSNIFIPFYGYIMLLFFCIISVNVLSLIIGSINLSLKWNNNMQLKNPVLNMKDASNLNNWLIRALNLGQDYQQYVQNQNLNKTTINEYYGKTSFAFVYPRTMGRTFRSLNHSMVFFTMYQSQIYNDLISKIISQLVPIVNPYQEDQTLKVQHLSVQDLYMNFLVDLYELSINKSLNKTIMSFSFWGFFTAMRAKSTLSPILQQSINSSYNSAVIFLAIVCVLTLLAIIPLYIALKRKNDNHIKIYDLVASIQGQLIAIQLQNLQNIIQIVFRANQSSQTLKSNVQNYQARKRSSILIKKQHQGQNQMISGLIQKPQKNEKNFNLKKQSKVLGHLEQNSSKISKFKNLLSKHFYDQTTLNIRKRGGEVDISNSQMDCKRPVLFNWILYILTLSTLYFLISITVIKINNFNRVSVNIQKIGNVLELKYNQSLLLLNQKLYFRGKKSPEAYFNGETLYSWLQQMIYSNKIILSQDENQNFEYHGCPTSTQYQYCKNKTYTISKLRYQLTQIIKNSHQVKKIIDQNSNSTNLNYTTQIKRFSELFFYAQVLNDRLQNITLDYIDILQKNMLEQNNQSTSSIHNYLIVSIIWGIFSILVELYIINLMKKAYFKQIMIVSFLNQQMILGNKRVQSFLQTLSRSSY